jgi:hypothetical protein
MKTRLKTLIQHFWSQRIYRILSILLLCVSITFYLFSSTGLSNAFYSKFYQPALYPTIRKMLDILFSSTDLNFFWYICVLFIILIIWFFYRCKKNSTIYQTIIKTLVFLLNSCLVVLLLFYWLWGFHYKMSPMQEFLNLDLKKLKELKIKEELNNTLNAMMYLRQENGVGDSLTIYQALPFFEDDELIYDAAEKLFYELRLNVYGRPGLKKFRPKGTLLRLKTLGFYNPLTGECNIESDLHPIQTWFIKAHEWTHAQGITDEGDANFLAYLITTQSQIPEIVYSGYMEYFRYLLSDLRKMNPELYSKTLEVLPFGVRQELLEIRASLQKYPDFMPKIRDRFYDSYLKINGISEGMDSYNRIVMMVVAYQRSKKI